MPPLAAIPFVAKFLGLPAWLRNLISGALAIALAALAFLWWLDRHTDAAVEADRKEAAAVIEARQAKAAEQAAIAAASESSRVEAGNAKARKAASDSADPLKAGLDSLRKR